MDSRKRTECPGDMYNENERPRIDPCISRDVYVWITASELLDDEQQEWR